MSDIINPQSSILDSDIYANFINQNYEQLQLLGAIISMDPAAAAFYDDFMRFMASSPQVETSVTLQTIFCRVLKTKIRTKC